MRWHEQSKENINKIFLKKSKWANKCSQTIFNRKPRRKQNINKIEIRNKILIKLKNKKLRNLSVREKHLIINRLFNMHFWVE